jgi:putative spermidine/putrescine transport system ATP-binding protein
MAELSLFSLTKRYGDLTVVDNFNIDVAEGEFLVLLGPSGCGKTTTLRMIAGFIPLTSGSIRIGARDVATLPPWKRNCGLVFQNYALFPHMNVADNVGFGLEMRKIAKRERGERVAEALRLVRLEHLAARFPRQLSGGQQQRVALARALVLRPDVLLLDEPLSNLDAKLRQDVRFEICELQRKLGLTTIMVTHDQEEALTMADRLVVMNAGKVRQIGTQRELYERPTDRFVAGFIGRTAFLDGLVNASGTFVSRGGLSLSAATSAHRGPASLALRPERIALGDAACQLENRVSGRVERVTYLGSAIEVDVRLNPHDRLFLHIPNQTASDEPREGDVIIIGWAAASALVYASD